MSQSDFVTRGQALISAGQYQEAVKVCRLGLLGRPATVEGRVVLGQALLALKRYDEVLAEMRVALELAPTSIPSQLIKAEALIRKRELPAAREALDKVRAVAPADPQLARLLREVERPRKPPEPSQGGGARGAEVNPFEAESRTQHYPHRGRGGDLGDEGTEDSGGSFTSPTTLPQTSGAARSAPGRLPPAASRRDVTPPPSVLAVGDRSGTVEVDPEAEGVELDDDDFGEPAQPPGSAAAGAASAARKRARSKHSVSAERRDRARRRDAPSAELDDDDEVMELEETIQPSAPHPGQVRPGPATAVRNAINRPSGPISDPLPPVPAASLRATVQQAAPSPPPHLAQLLASQQAGPLHGPVGGLHLAPLGTPGVQHVGAAPAAGAGHPPLGAQQLPQRPPPGLVPTYPAPGSMAPLPAPMPPPASLASRPGAGVGGPASPTPYGPAPGRALSAASVAAAAKQTVAAAPGPAVGAPFDPRAAAHVGHPGYPAQVAQDGYGVLAAPPRPPAPGHAGALHAAGADAMWAPDGSGVPRLGPDEQTRQPAPIHPEIAAAAAAHEAIAQADASSSQSRRGQPGARRARSRAQLALWIGIGAAMIGAGVLAGFEIRAMRLGKQITAARTEATSLANTDTWTGWIGARNRLASIAQASATPKNRAALARARAIMASELGDSTADAQAALDELGGEGGLDAELARAFVALARSDAPAAAAAADRALALAATDPAALYASGQVALLAGDIKGAIAALQRAVEREPRPMYMVGLARAQLAATHWDDALAATAAALKATPDHPGALIARGVALVEGGRVRPGDPVGAEIRTKLEAVVREGARPLAEQTRGVPPLQVALAQLSLARVEAARGNDEAAKLGTAAALDVGLDDQRFAEELSATMYALGRLVASRAAATRALATWPASARARITLAQVALAQGNAPEALEVLGKLKDVGAHTRALAVRGATRLATGDLDGARTDLDTALRRLPRLELAIAARAKLDLAAGERDEARRRLEGVWKAGATSPLIATAYASVLRAVGDPASREKARTVVEKVAVASISIDLSRAQLEYARALRDLGELRAAREAYEAAVRVLAPDARLELALVQIEDRDPAKGHTAIEALVKEAGPRAGPALLLEAARARMLVGDHAGALTAIGAAAGAVGVEAWQLDRERGRYAHRRGDSRGAAQALSRALDACGDDVETFLLAADAASSDTPQPQLVAKLQRLAKERLTGRVEATILVGKLALAEGRLDEADAAYTAARDTFAKTRATPRLQAQAELGRAVVAYNRQEDAIAQAALQLAIALDPTIYSAYQYLADLLRENMPERAFALIRQAVAYNPDLVGAWGMYGVLAHRLRKRAELAEAIARLGSLVPGSVELQQLQRLR